MRRRWEGRARFWGSSCALLFSLSACGDTAGPGGGGPLFGGITLGNPGLGGAGFSGYEGTILPTAFSYLFARAAFGEGSECIASGRCGHGGASTQYAGLQATPGDSLLFVTTSDVSTQDEFGTTRNAVVSLSGLEHDAITFPASPTGKALRLTLELAFLQSGASPQDSAVIQLVVNGQQTRIFLIRGSAIGSAVPARAGGCGTASVGASVSFPLCTDWQTVHLDVTAFRGQTTPIRFIVGETGRTAGRAATLVVRGMTFEEEL